MGRRLDLEAYLRRGYGLICEYETLVQLSADPREKARAQRVLMEQRSLAAGYWQEYVRLCGELHLDLPEELREIASALNYEIPEADSLETVSDMSELRGRLDLLDDVELETLCLDYFPKVYDHFSRGLRRDEKLNLLLDHCRRHQTAAKRLAQVLQDRTL